MYIAKKIIKNNSKLIQLFVFVSVLFIGLILRFHNYSMYPQRGATADEYSYSFQGVSLLTKGVPISWSTFTMYGEPRHLTINNMYFPIVQPYFDHTPLNGIITGGWAIAFGEDTFEKIQLKTIRIVPIVFSTISSILVFLIGRKLYSYKVAIWALLIYSTTTTFVIQGRVVLAENLLTVFFLSAVYAFLCFSKKLTVPKAILLGAFSGLSFWTKEIGIAVFFSLLYLFLSERIKIRSTFAFVSTAVVSIGLYVSYGMYFGEDVFFKILTEQSSRNIGPETLLYITSTPIIINKFYYDGWYFFGFLTFFISFLFYKESKYILVPAVVYFLLLLSALTQKGEMGWYIIPLFPFMSLLMARYIADQSEKIGFGILPFLLFVGLYNIEFLWKASFGLTPLQFRILLAVLIVPVLFSIMYKKQKLYPLISHFWFYTFIVMNILLTYNYVHPV